MKKSYYRVGEISRATGIAKSTLFDACRRGEIQAMRLGKALFIPHAEAKRLLGEPNDEDNRGGQTNE